MRRPLAAARHGLPSTNDTLWDTQRLVDQQEARMVQLARRAG